MNDTTYKTTLCIGGLLAIIFAVALLTAQSPLWWEWVR